ncbi:MAG TPA: ABC transporter substrate-binding protein [Limnochordia bacterium]
MNRFRSGWRALCGGLLIALTAAAAVEARVQIDFWNLFTGGDGDIMREIVQQFNEAQDDVEVVMTILPWGDPYYSKLLTATIAGAPPQVAVVHASRMLPYVSQGLLMEFTPAILAQNGLRAADFFQTPWRAGQYRGRQYAIPLDIHPYALYFNTDHFAQAGLSDHGPANGEELVLAARKLTLKGSDGRVSRWGYGWAGAREWFGAIFQFGGRLLEEGGTEVGFLDGSGQRAIEYYARLIEAVGGAFGGDFAQQTLSMMQLGPWEIGRMERAGVPFRTVPMPQIGPQGNAVWTDSHLLAIPAPVASGERAKLDAALTFIRWLTENAHLWSAGAGHVPTLRRVIASDAFRKLEHQLAFANSLAFARYYPQVGKSTELESAIHEAVWSAWNKQVAPGPALEGLAERIEQLVAEDRRS